MSPDDLLPIMRAHAEPITWPSLARKANLHPVVCWDMMRELLKQEKIVRSHVENFNPYYKLNTKPKQESLCL